MINLKQVEEISKKLIPNKSYFIKYNNNSEEDRRKKFREFKFIGFADNDKLIFEKVQENSYRECFSLSDYISRYIVILTREEYKAEANKKLWEKIEKVIK